MSGEATTATARRRRDRRLLAALTLGLVGSACCAPAIVAQRPYPAPDPQALLQELRRRQQLVTGVDLETRAESWLGGQRTKASVLMLVERQGRLRFEAEVSLQGTVATLVTDGKTFSLLDLQEQVFKQGPACPENIASLLPVPLQPPEIAAILLGDAPLAPDARAVGLGWDGKAAADVLEIDNTGAGSAITQRLWVSMRPGPSPAAPWEVVGLEAASAGAAAGGGNAGDASNARWRVAFDDRKIPGGDDPAGKLPFAKTIRFAEPGKSFDDGVEIVVKERKLNPAFRPQAFLLAAPEGFPVMNVPCPKLR